MGEPPGPGRVRSAHPHTSINIAMARRAVRGGRPRGQEIGGAPSREAEGRLEQRLALPGHLRDPDKRYPPHVRRRRLRQLLRPMRSASRIRRARSAYLAAIWSASPGQRGLRRAAQRAPGRAPRPGRSGPSPPSGTTPTRSRPRGTASAGPSPARPAPGVAPGTGDRSSAWEGLQQASLCCAAGRLGGRTPQLRNSLSIHSRNDVSRRKFPSLCSRILRPRPGGPGQRSAGTTGGARSLQNHGPAEPGWGPCARASGAPAAAPCTSCTGTATPPRPPGGARTRAARRGATRTGARRPARGGGTGRGAGPRGSRSGRTPGRRRLGRCLRRGGSRALGARAERARGGIAGVRQRGGAHPWEEGPRRGARRGSCPRTGRRSPAGKGC